MRRDAPGAHTYAPDDAPVSEPEYPHDGKPDGEGWVTVEGMYRPPSAARMALIELHLRWAPNARVEWSRPTLEGCNPPASRKVR